MYQSETKFECRVCNYKDAAKTISFGQQPIVHRLTEKVTNAEYYDFTLGCCSSCGFVQILNPIRPEILYENYITMSGWKNQPHADRQIDIIENITNLNKESKILDVGCNDGSYLDKLKARGYTNIAGIEPTEDASQIAHKKGHNIIKQFLNQENVSKLFEAGSYDLITTRQVLEHIIDLKDFLVSIKYLLKNDGMLVVEVPDSSLLFENADYGLWEEHANYFTKRTLKLLLNMHGFEIIHTETTLFSGVAVTVFCRKSEGKYVNIIREKSSTEFQVENIYFNQLNEFQRSLKNYLANLKKPIAIYGCGARSSNFVNFHGIKSYIECFIDDQTEKQYLFVPGCDKQILPYHKKFRDYHILLGVNTENENIVIRKRELNINDLCSICPPSFHIPKFWRSYFQ